MNGIDTAMQLTLASTSPYRKTLLQRLGLPFGIESPGIDETPEPHESPRQTACRLAREKAFAVASRMAHGLVIGSDQVAELEGVAVNKPLTRENAVAQLRRASGQTLCFHTALSVVQAETGEHRQELDVCRVTFRALSGDTIQRYIDLENPLDCAGSFKSEGLGIALIEKIEGEDPNALVGLPLIRLCSLLAHFGVTVI